MATKQVVSNAGQVATIAGRAAEFLAINYAGPNATKRIACAFGVGVSTAKLLRAGRRWTTARLDQAAKIFGKPFIEALWPPADDEFHDRFDRLEGILVELRKDLRGEQ